jgi:glycosyltransferase involved in cell wall biosynthesis
MEPLKLLMDEFEIDFYVTSSPSSEYEPFLEGIKANVITLPYSELTKALMNKWRFKKLVVFRTILLDSSIRPYVFEVIRRRKYHVVDTIENYTYSSLQVVMSKPFSKTYVVVMNWENMMFPPWRFSLKYLVNRWADAFRVPSLTAKWKLIAEGVKPDKVHFIPACVDTKRFNPNVKSELKKKLGIEGKHVTLYVGRLSPEKGLPYLLKAFAKITSMMSNAVLVIVGNGPLKIELQKLGADLNLTGHILFLDPIPYHKVQEAHIISDVTVLPSIPTKSWMEQFGYVLVEAMACGKPVVASRSGAIPEIVDDGKTGFLTKPEDVNDLTEKLKTLLTDEKLRREMGCKGRAKVEAKFSYEAVIPQLRKLYRSFGE